MGVEIGVGVPVLRDTNISFRTYMLVAQDCGYFGLGDQDGFGRLVYWHDGSGVKGFKELLRLGPNMEPPSHNPNFSSGHFRQASKTLLLTPQIHYPAFLRSLCTHTETRHKSKNLTSRRVPKALNPSLCFHVGCKDNQGLPGCINQQMEAVKFLAKNVSLRFGFLVECRVQGLGFRFPFECRVWGLRVNA